MSSNSTSSLSSFADRLSHEEKTEIDLLIAKLIFKANLSFRLVEKKEFNNLIKKLRPSYPGITRKTISDHYLDDEYEKIVIVMKHIKLTCF